MKVGYARVSTSKQDLDIQINLLREKGVEEHNIFKEKASGTSSTKRTELDRLLNHVREDDIVIISKIDRLARSIIDLNNIVRLFADKGVSIHFIKDNLYFEAGNTNSMNTLIFNMLASFAQFERDLIVERTSEGRLRAKNSGKHMGRKPSSSKKDIERAIKLYNERDSNNMTVADILKVTGVKKSTFYFKMKNH